MTAPSSQQPLPHGLGSILCKKVLLLFYFMGCCDSFVTTQLSSPIPSSLPGIIRTPRSFGGVSTSGESSRVHWRQVLRASWSRHNSKHNDDFDDDDDDDQKECHLRDSFNLVVLGDLHMEDDMSHHVQGRSDCLEALDELSLLLDGTLVNDGGTTASILPRLEEARAGDLSATELEILVQYKRRPRPNSYLVSLGDLGRKDIRHEPGDAGTTRSFEDARDFLDGFGLPYELITGNHDLEGMDEFDTDVENLEAWRRCFGVTMPSGQFCRRIGRRTLLIGLSTTRFRDAPFSSHEVYVDDAQLEWFRETVEAHPHADGWKLLIFSHAPVAGSGLRALQNVHILNGCAWLNHCSPPETRNVFVEICRRNPQIVLWMSGHFHLSHDFADAISWTNHRKLGQTEGEEGDAEGDHKHNQNACTFVQVGVMGPASARGHQRQTRIVQGNSRQLRIYTVNHHLRAMDKKNDDNETVAPNDEWLRLDATIDLTGEQAVTTAVEREQSNNSGMDTGKEKWFRAYLPEKEDGCYLTSPDGQIACTQTAQSAVCWWHMADGAVLGLHEGQLVEYDADTLAPLGIVVRQSELAGRRVLVVDEGRSLVLLQDKEDVNDDDRIEVVHPNEDGSYWRKVQRNKRIRMLEKSRERNARVWLENNNAL